MKIMTPTLIVILLLQASPLLANTLTIHVSGIDSVSGEIRLALFDQPQGFPDEASRLLGEAVTASSADASGKIIFRINNVEPGIYAIAIYQDKNGNQQLDTNFLGFPVEPYAISNGIRARLGKPKFDDARFEKRDKDMTINVTLD